MSAMRVRALTRREHEAFRLARLVATEQMPYFAHALFAVAPLACEGLGTFAVDRAWRLYMDPTRLLGAEQWSRTEAAGVLVHEVGHLIRDHGGRATALPQPLDALLWNYAADAEINDDLLDAGLVLPEGAITPTALGLCAHGLAEDYYRSLVPPDTNSGRRESDDEDGVSCGSGSGCEPMPAELGADSTIDGERVDQVSGAAADLVRRQVARDVQHATEQGGCGRGTVPAGLRRWAAEVLAPPQVPWQRVLRAVLRRVIAHHAGRVDYTYSRPSRRRVPKVILPAMRGPRVRVALVVDTSGSMSDGALASALSEISGVLTTAAEERDQVRVLSCDAATGTVQRVRSVSDIALDGGGGTDMRVGIAAAEALNPPPHVVVVLTDGYTPWPDAAGKASLVCAVIGEGPDGPAWARTVRVDPARAA